MKWAGFGQNQREIVAKRILGKVEMNNWNLEHLGRPLYRYKEERRLKVKEDKSSWFRAEGATTTVTVPTTENSILAKQLREVLAKNPGPRGTSVKVLERPGPPLMAGIAANNPFKDQPCWKPHCPLESTGQKCKGRCMTEGIIYRATCQKCEEQQLHLGVKENEVIQHQYIGETSRTLDIRSNQHKKDFLKASNNNTTSNQDKKESSSENELYKSVSHSIFFHILQFP